MQYPGPTTPPPTTSRGWWTGAIGYQIYVRSFSDTTGNGIGDLTGVRNNLAHLAELGVDYLWLTPFYPSPQADHGYDVANYCDVDPTYGDLRIFSALVDDAHALGLRVVIDIVPNHSSDRHPWFVDALTSRDASYRDHYVWREPAPDGGPPNNWVSKFGGPAWSWHASTGQYYMHTFLPEQPDLNWANPAVHHEFDRILEFWLELGVDGFRIDTAHLLTEDAGYRDNPLRRPIPPGADPDTVYHCYDHLYDLDQPDVLDTFRRWQDLLADRDVLLLGEVGLFEAVPVARYVRDGALDLAFYFPTLKVGWDANEIRRTLKEAITVAEEAFAWPLSSHDDPRAAQRFNIDGRGAARARAYLTLLAGLPGSTVILQGDELGIDTTQIGEGGLRDPVATRNGHAGGRDLSRTPMLWNADPHFGFSVATPWLPIPTDTTHRHTVEHQQRDPCSPLRRTRELIHLHRHTSDLRGPKPVRWLEGHHHDIVAYQRGHTIVALNTADTPRPLPQPSSTKLLYSSADRPHPQHAHTIPADTTVIVETG